MCDIISRNDVHSGRRRAIPVLVGACFLSRRFQYRNGECRHTDSPVLQTRATFHLDESVTLSSAGSSSDSAPLRSPPRKCVQAVPILKELTLPFSSLHLVEKWSLPDSRHWYQLLQNGCFRSNSNGMPFLFFNLKSLLKISDVVFIFSRGLVVAAVSAEIG
jgi:hypothetical protein